ncbi:calcineurin-like phosphoesterase [Microdochium trichocladiopsis]|uniref:Calcineurin-like phosphoesterase n=1 Tax=Microdochium trichocladiopsis TaxID=1682393 RepID=A0A9P8YBN4_9PEZI|nr:calcineurin-like phosphoesterase [Microdochium trichocladiopsis]KAH7035421.1 calcineurin-like phosphoesterase [Microdochium trichocladiopsis]
MGLLQQLATRRSSKWEPPTLLDCFLKSPLQAVVYWFHLLFIWLRGIPVRPPKVGRPLIVVCISDTHDSLVPKVPDGDLLIHAGDTTSLGSVASIQRQIDWLAALPHQHKVLVAGNHDNYFDPVARKEEDALRNLKLNLKGVHYLEHNALALSFSNGRRLNLYGAPGIPKCGGSDNAFQYLSQDDPWRGAVPRDTEILISHTPPLHHMDLSLGCPSLLAEVWRVKPLVHVFGHVHWGRGMRGAYWDDSQRAYEKFMGRQAHGPIYDMIPSMAWIDALRFLLLNVKALLWQWLMLGGVRPNGSVMINAAVQAGNTGKLVKDDPFTIIL